MYSYEDRIRAVKFYITCGYNAAYTVSKLGYPDASNLKHWYKEYSESNDLHKGRKKVSKFSDREKRDAVDYYFAHDRNALQTVKALGYPSRPLLIQWVKELCPEEGKRRCKSFKSHVRCSQEEKIQAVDYNLKIIQMNQAATKLFNVPKKRRLIGKPVSEIMDDYSLASILAFDRNLMQDEIYLEDQKCYLDRVMTNDKENKMILCIMKDITKERKHKDQIYHAQVEAARMADKLVEEQLKIVQQIAGLLGETAADTKVAVEKLKNTILLESEEPNEKK